MILSIMDQRSPIFGLIPQNRIAPRQTLSFSKKLNNHIGAIWYFVHGYNAPVGKGLNLTTTNVSLPFITPQAIPYVVLRNMNDRFMYFFVP